MRREPDMIQSPYTMPVPDESRDRAVKRAATIDAMLGCTHNRNTCGQAYGKFGCRLLQYDEECHHPGRECDRKEK